MILYHVTLAVAATTVVLSGGIGALAWRRRPEPGTTWLAIPLFASCWWVASLGGGTRADSLAEKLLWVRLEWIGVALLPVAWLLFALEYTGRHDGLSRSEFAGVGTTVAAVVAAVWANPRGLVRRDVALRTSGGVTYLEQTYGPLFWVLVGAMFTLATLGTLVLLALARRSRSLYRGQAIALSAAALLPLAGAVTFLGGGEPLPALHVLPIAFTLSGILNVWAVSRYRLLDRLPVPRRVARDIVVEQMDDGVVVVDGRGEIVDANDRAAALLGDCGNPVGVAAESYVPGYAAAVDDGEAVVVTNGRSCRWLKVRVTPIRNVPDRITGRIVVLSDVTDRRNRQQRLDVLNRVLRHNLRNEINVVYGYAERLGGDSDGETATAIKEKASAIVELADKAREVERVLDEANIDGEPVDVLSALECALDDIEDGADGATVELHPPDRTDVFCHRVVEPVVANLIENVLRHADVDDPEIEVSVVPDRNNVRVDVAADGAGVPKAELSAVRDESETQLNHANGLRLWLVVWGTRRIGGTVTFHPDDDTVATLRFARRDPPQGATGGGVGGWTAEG